MRLSAFVKDVSEALTTNSTIHDLEREINLKPGDQMLNVKGERMPNTVYLGNSLYVERADGTVYIMKFDRMISRLLIASFPASSARHFAKL